MMYIYCATQNEKMNAPPPSRVKHQSILNYTKGIRDSWAQ